MIQHPIIDDNKRCHGMTEKAIRCRRKVSGIGSYCKQHQNQIGSGSGRIRVDSNHVTIIYGSFGVAEQEVTVNQTRGEPEVIMPTLTLEPTALYTLVMVDPDAPAAKANGNEFLHWLLINIPGDEEEPEGFDAVKYHEPSPPPGSGVHRYLFYLFKQPYSIHPTNFDRKDFNLQKFTTTYGLTLVKNLDNPTYFTIKA